MRTHALHILLTIAALDVAWHVFHLGEIAHALLFNEQRSTH